MAYLAGAFIGLIVGYLSYLLFRCEHEDIRHFGGGRLEVMCLKCGRISVGVPCETRVKVTR